MTGEKAFQFTTTGAQYLKLGHLAMRLGMHGYATTLFAQKPNESWSPETSVIVGVVKGGDEQVAIISLEERQPFMICIHFNDSPEGQKCRDLYLEIVKPENGWPKVGA